MTVNSAGAHTHSVTVANSGGGQAHDNMPPYLAVNMWRRTA
jgi:microcystin-dependent protein